MLRNRYSGRALPSGRLRQPFLRIGRLYKTRAAVADGQKEETMIAQEKKAEIIKEFGRKEGDTGSPEVQIAILTARITELTEHMKKNPKDYHSNRGLLKLVGQRRGLLDYLKKTDLEKYRALIERLGIRK